MNTESHIKSPPANPAVPHGTITIDDRPVEFAAGETVLQAARRLGLDIPTLCYLEQCGPMTSCLVCVVKVKLNGQGRLVPSCATRALPGMIVESETDEVRAARRTALELLLSDHVGDCLSPCHRICPLALNVPRMIRQIQAHRLDEAIRTLKHSVALPAVLGRLCHHPCENGCRRGVCDSAAAIRDLERYVAESDLNSHEPYLPSCRLASGKSVGIVGAGPTGLTAAYHLLREGHACTIFDRQAEPGGSLRAVDHQALPPTVLDAEVRQLEKLGAQFGTARELGRDLSLGELAEKFDAVLLAPGQLARSEIDALGLAATATGVQVNPQTFQTSTGRILAAGSAVKPAKQLIRAMSDGQEAARCIHEFLSTREVHPAGKPFSSVMGRLEKAEVERVRACGSPAARVEPAAGANAGFTETEAVREAQRCLHCDCRAAGDCRLQHYAELYGVDPNRFTRQRRLFEQHARDGTVLFEPGKCILCGICVQLTKQAGEPLGLTFIGRGFDVRVAAPLNRPFADGLQKVAADCVAHCPTGALAFKDEKTAPGS
ncbi:MAG: FAD-dependent oxidoreductase [Limisphaerales bacterium]